MLIQYQLHVFPFTEKEELQVALNAQKLAVSFYFFKCFDRCMVFCVLSLFVCLLEIDFYFKFQSIDISVSAEQRSRRAPPPNRAARGVGRAGEEPPPRPAEEVSTTDDSDLFVLVICVIQKNRRFDCMLILELVVGVPSPFFSA